MSSSPTEVSHSSRAARIEVVAHLLDRNEIALAAEFLRVMCPTDAKPSVLKVVAPAVAPSLSHDKRTTRKYSASQATNLFIRDGFIDRYTGERLVFPGVLRLISHLFPSEFPYHSAWKFGVGHSWYWELFPSVDHVVPVTHAGADSEENWVTTSFNRNFARSNYSVADLGWHVRPIELHPGWDGLICWYRRYLQAHSELQKLKPLRHWYLASACVEPLPNSA
jgi:hypothetical protein